MANRNSQKWNLQEGIRLLPDGHIAEFNDELIKTAKTGMGLFYGHPYMKQVEDLAIRTKNLILRHRVDLARKLLVDALVRFDEIKVAQHEAAHAVVVWRFREQLSATINCVTVNSKEASRGVDFILNGVCKWSGNIDSIVAKRAAIAVAYASTENKIEIRVTKTNDPYGYGKIPDQGDQQEEDRLLDDLSNGESEIRNQLKTEAMKIAADPCYYNLVQKLARKLLRKTTMLGSDVETFLNNQSAFNSL